MYRILGIAPTPFFSDRGCHVRILEEARVLTRLGHKVTICTYHLGRDPEGVTLHRIPHIPWYSKHDAGPSWHKYYIDMLLTVRALLSGLRDKPDIVHGHLHEGVFIGYFVSRILDVPLVFDLQGSLTGEMLAHDFISTRGLFYSSNRFLEKLTTQMADVILASSVGAASYLQDDPDLNGKKVHIVPEGIDVQPYDASKERETLRASLGISRDDPLCVYMGVLYPYQGIDALIRSAPIALELCPALQFLVIGFPHVEHYRQMAERLGLGERFHFVGKVHYENVPEYLKAGDLAVTPKDSQTEANSKIYNFMAAALPVVAYDTATNRSLLGELGVYVTRGDETGLAKAVGSLAADHTRRKDLGEAVRRKAQEEFSWMEVGRKIVTIYEDLLRGRG